MQIGAQSLVSPWLLRNCTIQVKRFPHVVIGITPVHIPQLQSLLEFPFHFQVGGFIQSSRLCGQPLFNNAYLGDSKKNTLIVLMMKH